MALCLLTHWLNFKRLVIYWYYNKRFSQKNNKSFWSTSNLFLKKSALWININVNNIIKSVILAMETWSGWETFFALSFIHLFTIVSRQTGQNLTYCIDKIKMIKWNCVCIANNKRNVYLQSGKPAPPPIIRAFADGIDTATTRQLKKHKT